MTMLRPAMLVAFLAFSALAGAQSFPSRAITIVVGFAPGGGTDSVARVVGKTLADQLGQQVVVDNKAGAGGTIAVDFVAKASPDGHAVVLANVGAMTANPHLMKLGYDPLKDLVPISMATIFGNVILAQPQLGVKTVDELIRLARQKPGQLTYGSSGFGGAAHLAGELLEDRAKVFLVHVPYKGGGPAMAGFLGNQTDLFISVPVTSLPHINAGRAVAVAVTSPKRSALMPNIPTVAESGYPGFDATNWYAFYGPRGMAKDLVERWNREIVKALNDPATVASLQKQGVEPAPGTPEELARYTEAEFRTWGRLIRETGIKAE
jgi:tripartite-type tricarboxylate transporter receptor subunit TctC